MKGSERAAFKYIALALLGASILLNHPTILLSPRKLTWGTDGRSVDDDLLPTEEVDRPKLESINLIGERHSATKWITSHLQNCFGDQVQVVDRYTRYKHWFQYDDKEGDSTLTRDSTIRMNYHPPGSSLVVAMFRDPYDWIDSMRKKPYHSPMHFDLDWRAFLTTPWTMERGQADKDIIRSGKTKNATCMHRFTFDELVPCSRLDRNMYNGTFHGKKVGVNYELKHDGSGLPYNSILDLRRDKILNFLDVANFDGVAAFLPVQFEFVVTQGSGELLDEIENITGLQARCKRAPPRTLIQKSLDDEYFAWMNDHVDWEVESRIGYSRRDS